MRNKLRQAGTIAVAATITTALFSAEGSGAAAQQKIPELIDAGTLVEFISEPVIQALPSDTEQTTSADGAEVDTSAVASATSLRQHVAAQPVPHKLSREMECLASAIYFEARGESLEGQLAVGRVITERAGSDRFPSSYCGVVFQRAQFSFIRGARMPAIRKHSQAWRNAVAIAHIADAGSWDSPAEGALFFHATHVSPGWRRTRLARVDNHIFYR